MGLALNIHLKTNTLVHDLLSREGYSYAAFILGVLGATWEESHKLGQPSAQGSDVSSQQIHTSKDAAAELRPSLCCVLEINCSDTTLQFHLWQFS